MKNRIISLMLVLVLVFTLLPVYAIADANAETEPKDDPGMTLEQSPDIQALVDQIKKLLNGGQDSEQLKARLKELLKDLDSKDMSALFKALIKQLPKDQLDKLLGALDDPTIQKIFGMLKSDEAKALVETIKKLIAGEGDVKDLLSGLSLDQVKALLELFIDKDDLDRLFNNIPQEELEQLLKDFLNGNGKLEDIFKLIPEDALKALLESLKGKNDILDKLLENINPETLLEALRGLIGGDGNIDIEDILRNLNKDELLELFKQFIDDNETLKKLLENLDSDQIADILKKLLEGGFDINGLLKNLDAYTFLKFIAGLMGSELDVTGPNDVTVKEGESATFKVKVNTAGTYKYLWLEPDAVKSIDFGGIDLSGSKLQIALKLLAALKKVSLSTTDTLTIAKAAASDNGRAFACMIYNVDLKSPTMYITNEAKLTVAAHEHTKVIDTPAVAATCTKDGCTEGSHCSECGEVLSKSEVIPATGHNYVHKVCANCGDEIPFPFTDVKKTDWCYNDVKYVWQYDIMFGVSDTKFGPRTYMTRAMFVTVLYRLEGSPSVEGMQIPAFTDIGAKWCYDAIIWAYNTHVTYGKTATTFDPNASITRAEIVAMIYRYAGSPSVSGSLGGFVDASSIGAWAKDAVIWATSLGVIHGYTDGRFGPNRTALRSEMAAMLHRYMEMSSVL